MSSQKQRAPQVGDCIFGLTKETVWKITDVQCNAPASPGQPMYTITSRQVMSRGGKSPSRVVNRTISIDQIYPISVARLVNNIHWDIYALSRSLAWAINVIECSSDSADEADAKCKHFRDLQEALSTTNQLGV